MDFNDNYQKGFALLQVMVLTAVIIGITYLATRQSALLLKELRSETIKKELQLYTQNLQIYLADIQNCSQTFRGLKFSTSQLPFTSSINQFFFKGAKLGSNNQYEIVDIYLTNTETGFMKLVFTISMNSNLQRNYFLPKDIKKDVHLFTHFSNTNEVDFCYFDPFDNDYEDQRPNGLISQHILHLCDYIRDSSNYDSFLKGHLLCL